MNANSQHGKPHGLSMVSTAGIGTTVNAQAISGTQILLSYNTMPGNQPSTYSDTVFIWQSGPTIPYNQKPLGSQAVPTNTQSGSMVFKDLQIQTKDYIIGYAVGADPTNICSWAYIPPVGGGQAQTFQTSLSVPAGGIQPDVVLVMYDTPAGNQPQSNSQWVGIWQGSIASFTAAPLAQITCSTNNSQDQIGLPVTLLRSTSYTLGFLMGKKQTTLAAAFTFST
jgi:hypothetical protein